MRFRRRRGLGGRRDREEGDGGGNGDGGADGRDGDRGGSGRPSIGRTGRRWLYLGLALVVCFVGAYLTSKWLFSSSDASEAGVVVRVPDLVGLTEKEAGESLESADLELTVGSEVPHPRAAQGAVLAQSPLPGGYARPGAPVSVTLSSGPELRRVPDVRGLTGRRSEIVLERMGLRVRLDTVRSLVDRGRVVGTRPEAGSELTLPAEVSVLVSEGPEVARVPDLVGRHVEDVEELLGERGLRLGEVTYDPDAFAASGRVIGQYPSPGFALRVDGEVAVQVAGEPPESSEPGSDPGAG